MRVLLDESLPPQLVRELTGHTLLTVAEQGCKGLKNSELLGRALAEGFEVFVTADQNLEYQQNLAKLGVGVVVLVARTNPLVDLKPLVPDVLRVLPNVDKGQVVRVGG